MIAGKLIKEIDIGDQICCDFCSKDFTKSEETGGFMFGSYGTGPCCAKRIEANAKKHGETWNITKRCPEGMSFRQWILSDIRGGDNTIRYYEMGRA